MTKEEAISAFKEWIKHDEKMEYADRLENIEIYNMAIQALEQEPCEDATLKDIFCMGCEYKEQQPCEDAINKQAVLESIEDDASNGVYSHFASYEDAQKFKETIKALSPVIPIRPKGKWIVKEDNTSFVRQIPRRWVECSHCGWSFSYDSIQDDFCTKCGADMRGET